MCNYWMADHARGQRTWRMQNVEGELFCEDSSERYSQDASMLDESTMAEYGGHSNECDGCCDDVGFDFLSLQ